MGRVCSQRCRRSQQQFRQARATLPFVHAPRVAFRSARVCGSGLGAAAFGGRRHRPAAVDRISADAARHPAAARRAGAHRARRRPRSGARRLRADDAGRTRCHRAAGRRAYTRRWTIRRCSSASACCISRRPATAKRRAGWAAPHWRRDSCCRRTRPSAPNWRACAVLAAARPHGSARRTLQRRIDPAIEPFDTAGLLDASRRDWYPVLADDLLASAAKFAATREEVLALLERTGMLATHDTRTDQRTASRSSPD